MISFIQWTCSYKLDRQITKHQICCMCQSSVILIYLVYQVVDFSFMGMGKTTSHCLIDSASSGRSDSLSNGHTPTHSHVFKFAEKINLTYPRSAQNLPNGHFKTIFTFFAHLRCFNLLCFCKCQTTLYSSSPFGAKRPVQDLAGSRHALRRRKNNTLPGRVSRSVRYLL